MISRSTLAAMFVAAAQLITPTNTAAAEDNSHAFPDRKPISVIDNIKGIDQVARAKVALMPSSIMFRIALTEGGLWNFGCPFVTDDPSRTKSLVDILRQADLDVVEPTEPGWMGETREGVSLVLANGTEVRFFFTINFINAGVRGYFYYGADFYGRHYLTAKSTLPDELIAWGGGIGASIPKDIPSDQLTQVQQVCEHFARAR
jgi:hypothetical protein